MSNLGTEREIAKYFALSSVNLRPEACQVVLQKIEKMTYTDEKREFLARFLKYFKEWQSLNQKSSSINKQISAIQMDNAILDLDTAHKIFSSMNMSNSKTRTYSPEKTQKKSFASFKGMKKAA
jgi:hypothetical protein